MINKNAIGDRIIVLMDKAKSIAEKKRLEHVNHCLLMSESISFIGVPDVMECFWNLCVNEFDIEKYSPEYILAFAVSINAFQKTLDEKYTRILPEEV